MYSMTKCDNIGIKAVYTYKNRIVLLQGAEKCNQWDYLLRTFDLISPSCKNVAFYKKS